MNYNMVEHYDDLYERIFLYLNQKLIEYKDNGLISEEQFLEIAKYERENIKNIMTARKNWS